MYISRNGLIELRIVGYEEPNNGRELHVAQLFVNQKDQSKSFFKNGWNRLNFNLQEFQFESENSEFVFIPAEGNSFIINLKTFELTYIPYKSTSTVLFLKNEFHDDKLTVYYRDETIDVELK